ncbi:MAG: flagellar protein FlaG [bacterium]
MRIDNINSSLDTTITTLKQQLNNSMNSETHVKENAVFQEKNQIEKSFQISEEKLKESLSELNSVSNFQKQGIRFEYFKEANRMMVKIVDLKTQETIKEAPPREMIELSKKIKEMVGIILDELI